MSKQLGLAFRVFVMSILMLMTHAAYAQKSDAVCAQLYHGIGYSAPTGTPVPLAADGEVVSVSKAVSFGRFAKCDQHIVVLHKHANGRLVYTRYGEIFASRKVGDKLKAKDSVGTVGASGEFFFEVRPITGGSHQQPPNWSAVGQTDPSKFDFNSFGSTGDLEAKPTTWTRYQKADLDEVIKAAFAMYSNDLMGIKHFPQPAPYRFTLQMVADPYPCDSRPGIQMWGNIYGRALPPMNYCVDLRSKSGKVVRLFVQDPVAALMAREIAIGETLEVFVLHLFTNSGNAKNANELYEKGSLGLAVNEFNVIP